LVSDVDLALKRIADRVKNGGHNLPENVVRRRFKKGLQNLFRIYRPLLDTWVLLDNSTDTPNLIALEELSKLTILNTILYNESPIRKEEIDYDKFEEISELFRDVIDFKSSKKYDLILSISTLEHVGWDEEIKESDKILYTIENLKSCLADMGILIVTMPLGYNSYLDILLKEKRIEFTKTYFMKRITSDNKWAETAWEDVKDSKFSYDPVFANGLIIGIIKKKTHEIIKNERHCWKVVSCE